MRTDIEELCKCLAGSDLETALIDAATLLDNWSSRERTGDAGPLEENDARARLKATLIDRLQDDPSQPRASTIIWVIGKLFDDSLEPYLATLVELYIQREDLFSHLHQTLIALDNLGAIACVQHHEEGWSNTRELFPRMQRIGVDYLRMREERFR